MARDRLRARHTYIVGAVLLTAMTAPAAAQGTADAFSPFAFLVGHCWTGELPNRQGTDTHCYDWMLGREFVRDRHAITGAGGVRGESIYQWDAAAKRVSYRYWDSQGGIGHGTFTTEGAVLRTEEEEYQGKGSRAQRIRTVITRVGDTRYDLATDTLVDGQWRAGRRVSYTRGDPRPATTAASRGVAVAQLRATRGAWDVTTRFLKPDGSVARTATGTYVFDWVVEDHVLRGESDIPDLQTRAGILFYVDDTAGQLVMASVGRDGRLWVMAGPADGETRTTPDTVLPDGSTVRLRFTRFNVTTDRFESRMEVSADGGASWQPGNHQVFVRKTAA